MIEQKQGRRQGRAARSLDEDLILQLLEQMPPNQAPLAQALRALVDDFRLDKLIELTGCDWD
jgi:hypothetical protein